MEADSTTYEKNTESSDDICLPFSSSPEDLKFYKDLVSNNGNHSLESQLIGKLQSLGLIPKNITCPENGPNCKVSCKSARVVDRVQWLCEGCGKRQPIRKGTFFFRLQCSILQVLQIIFAWCEDADINTAAQIFDVKLKVACLIYDKLDELAIKQMSNSKLGGADSVVLSEMYPDCLNRLSPDTTDQTHVHQILMMADTKHVPTHYKLHVIQGDPKSLRSNTNDECLKEEIEELISRVVEPGSLLLGGNNVPSINGMVPLQQLIHLCNVDMQHFLGSRIWRQALSLCGAARELCAGGACAPLQRYLDCAALRLRHRRHFYHHTLQSIADDNTHTDFSS